MNQHELPEIVERAGLGGRLVSRVVIITLGVVGLLATILLAVLFFFEVEVTVKAGGITEHRKISALASAFHIPVAPHGSPHMASHLLASTPNALIMETYPGVQSRFNPALPLYPVKDGHITMPQTPGLGIDPDPAMVKKYKV